ncbi:hypothetical protein K502DRAFT_348592 [Neoconidiobolus thromboides FSU 785]|nr:hypothetical protein K502DRAFT_348592 [Neoconidiobolus thromboides FSU 785]
MEEQENNSNNQDYELVCKKKDGKRRVISRNGSFIAFLSIKKDAFMKQNSGMNYREMQKRVSQMWAHLPSEERKKYKIIYKDNANNCEVKDSLAKDLITKSNNKTESKSELSKKKAKKSKQKNESKKQNGSNEDYDIEEDFSKGDVRISDRLSYLKIVFIIYKSKTKKVY